MKELNGNGKPYPIIGSKGFGVADESSTLAAPSGRAETWRCYSVVTGAFVGVVAKDTAKATTAFDARVYAAALYNVPAESLIAKADSR